MTSRLRVIVVDDERPARSLLTSMLRRFDDVDIVAELGDGAAAVRAIHELRPDVALLDVQMPEVSGLDVVRHVRPDGLPLIIFVTAHDEHAVSAFELNAVDYLLKPVSQARLGDALHRAHERLERSDLQASARERVRGLAEVSAGSLPQRLDRIPIRVSDDIVLVPVRTIASIVADGELLHVTTVRNERHTLTFRLKDLEMRLDPDRFIRLGRGAIANVDAILKITTMPGGTHLVSLRNGQQLRASRIQSKELRRRLLTL